MVCCSCAVAAMEWAGEVALHRVAIGGLLVALATRRAALAAALLQSPSWQSLLGMCCPPCAATQSLAPSHSHPVTFARSLLPGQEPVNTIVSCMFLDLCCQQLQKMLACFVTVPSCGHVVRVRIRLRPELPSGAVRAVCRPL